MVRNDFLLRTLVVACLFWFIRPYVELISLFVGVHKETSFLVGIIGAGAIAVYLSAIFHAKIKNSILKNSGLSTTVKWLLYILVGISILTALITLIDTQIYSPFSIRQVIFTGAFFNRIGAFALLIGTFFVTLYATRKLVNNIGYSLPPGSPQVKPAIINANPSPVHVSNNAIAPPPRIRNDKSTVHGSSEFSNWENFNKKYNNKTNDEMYQLFEDTSGYVIRPNSVKYMDHAHMMTIAGAGQGKGTTAIIPNLLTQPNNSWIVLDVKGENAAVTARFQREAGQRVYILDPFGVQKQINARHGIPSSGFNPLVIAKYLPPDELSDFAAMLAEMFIPQVGKGNSSDNFWIDSARNLIKALVLHLMTDKAVTERNLGKLYEWLRLNQEDEVSLLVDMTANEYTKFAANEIRSLMVKSEKTWVGVLSEARRSTAFLESPVIRRSLEANDFDPMTLETQNTTAYIILPERNLNTHMAWLRIVFGTILKLCNFSAQRRVNFLMDEFPILGRMDDFLRAFAFGRGQKISCWIIAQSLSQLKDIYGEEGLNTFLANSKLRQFFGMNDYFTQKYVSDLLGTTTEIISTSNYGRNSGSNTNNSYTTFSMGSTQGSGNAYGSSSGENEQVSARPLMTPDEVGKLTNDFILLVDGDKYRIPKTTYYTHNVYPGRFDPNPYVS